MLVWVVGLAESLLPCNFARSGVHVSTWSRCTSCTKLSVWINMVSIVKALFFFFGTLLEKHFSQYVLLFLMGIIIFDVIIVRLIKDAVRIMVTIGVFVSYSSCLAYRVWVYAADQIVACVSCHLWPTILTVRALTRYQKYSFMKTTNYWYLGRLLRCRRISRRLGCLGWYYLIFR
jgi:hypothetical protein